MSEVDPAARSLTLTGERFYEAQSGAGKEWLLAARQGRVNRSINYCHREVTCIATFLEMSLKDICLIQGRVGNDNRELLHVDFANTLENFHEEDIAVV